MGDITSFENLNGGEPLQELNQELAELARKLSTGRHSRGKITMHLIFKEDPEEEGKFYAVAQLANEQSRITTDKCALHIRKGKILQDPAQMKFDMESEVS